MSDSPILDKIHDLDHHAYDAITGTLSGPSAPSKAPSTTLDASQHLGTGLADRGAAAIRGRSDQLDKQVADAGG